MKLELDSNNAAISRELMTFADRLSIRDGTIFKIIGRAVQQVIKAHFYRLASDQAHHKTATALGARRTGLYSEAARATQQPTTRGDGVGISINHVAIAQRFFGGTITPINGKFLTIPARAESYGKRAREFDNLVPIIFGGGQRGALIEREATVATGKNKGKSVGGGVFFWLVKRVVQQADPSVLPTEDDMLRPGLAAASDYIERLWERQAA